MRIIHYLAVSLLALTLAACEREAPAPGGTPTADARPVTIYAVNYPLAWAAQQLAGDAADALFPAPADIDPAFWQPDLHTIAAFQQADLVLLNGASYAKWIARVSLPQNRLLDTSQGFAAQLIAVDTGPLHSHGPEGDHSHGELAFTVWLDLSLYAKQVATIAAALSELLPESADVITRHRDELVDELQELDRQLMAIGKQLNGGPVLYSHPVYQYLQGRYQLNGKALHWEPGGNPTQAEWAQLDALLESQPARIMLWEDEPTATTREQLERRGIKPVVFRPMGNRPASGDFVGNLQADIARLAAALQAPISAST
jgi:zinc transport system substrate-binding protein